MTAYYNENDLNAAAWLRNLINMGEIADGEVDTRSIEDVTPNDLKRFTQCHFFAGIGGWSYALRLAGWPDDRHVWTGSCPCQPFSAAGKGGGYADERHLWPAFFHLIDECKPATVFGEQVASKDGLNWLDLVSTDLEGAGYAFGAADLCAAGVGAPHIRQRLWFVAHHNGYRREARERHGTPVGYRDAVAANGAAGIVGNNNNNNNKGLESGVCGKRHSDGFDGSDAFEPASSAWYPCDFIPCTDGKARPVEPGTQQMVNGLSLALGLLRGFGNAEKERLTYAAQSTGFITEILHQMQYGICPTEIWGTLGRCIGFSETTILLACLCEQSGELGQFFNGATSWGAQERADALREMRKNWPPSCASPRRELSQQFADELRDVMPQLPQESALLAMWNGFPLAHGVLGRVGLLRGYGNAIVPQVAAAFIECAS